MQPTLRQGAAEFAVFLDDGGPESELCGTDGADVAARTGADNDDVEFIHGNDDAALCSHAALPCHPERSEGTSQTARWVAGRKRRTSLVRSFSVLWRIGMTSKERTVCGGSFTSRAGAR
jgi:hypothetical protein